MSTTRAMHPRRRAEGNLRQLGIEVPADDTGIDRSKLTPKQRRRVEHKMRRLDARWSGRAKR